MQGANDGPLTMWRNEKGQIRTVAGDADSIMWFIRIQSDQSDWHIYGSIDQKEQVFVTAHQSIGKYELDTLTVQGQRLLPDGIQCDEIDMEGLSLFTNDSGNVVLTLR